MILGSEMGSTAAYSVSPNDNYVPLGFGLAHLAAAESAHPNFTNDFFLIRLGGEGYRRRFSGRVLLTVSPVSLRITYLPLLHILPGHQWFPEDPNNFPAFDSLEVALSSLQPVI